MPLILGAASAVATGYSIDNSCRFNRGDSDELHYTQVTPTDNNTWTISCWFKRGDTANECAPWGTWSDGSNQTKCRIMATTGALQYFDYQSGAATGRLNTNRAALDPSAWYHLVCVWDSDNGAAGDRMKMYINGVEQGSVGGYSLDTEPSSGQATIMNVSGRVVYIGRDYDGTYWDGYIADAIFIDGTAYAASDFGEFNEDSPTIWQPKDPTDLTFGNNGFWLDFKDSADLGNDVSGVGNDLTVANLTAVDQCVDSPTNNFCTLNPLDNFYSGATFSEGNCYVVGLSSSRAGNSGTMALTAGKWFWEIKPIALSSYGSSLGIVSVQPTAANQQVGDIANCWAKRTYNTTYVTGGVSTTYGTTIAADDIVGVALDLDNLKLYFSKGGVWMDDSSGTTGIPTSGATGTGAISITAVASTVAGAYFPAVSDSTDGAAMTTAMNFGNPPYANTSDAADGNGYGKFEYAPPSGYLAICTKNLGSDGG